jgi:hypothetical protein
MGKGLMDIVLPKEYMVPIQPGDNGTTMTDKNNSKDKIISPVPKQLQQINTPRSQIQLHRVRT